MKNPKNLFPRSMLYLSLTAAGAAHGVELADAPLVVQSPVEPNVVFLLDQSGNTGTPSQQISNTSGFDEDDNPDTIDTNSYKLEKRYNSYVASGLYERCGPDQVLLPPSTNPFNPRDEVFAPGRHIEDREFLKKLPKEVQDSYFRPPPKPHIEEHPFKDSPFFEIFFPHKPKFLETNISGGKPLWFDWNKYYVDTIYNDEGRLQLVHEFRTNGIAGYRMYRNVYDPEEVCFFDPHHEDEDPNFYYRLDWALGGASTPLPEGFTVTSTSVYGNYVDWYIRDNTIPKWTSPSYSRSVKPGLMTRFGASKKALSYVIEEIKKNRMPLRIGLATTAPPLYGKNPDGTFPYVGGVIEIGVDTALDPSGKKTSGTSNLNVDHLERFRHFIEEAKIEVPDSITSGVYSALADIAYYFMEGTFTPDKNKKKTVSLYKGDDPKESKIYTYKTAEAFRNSISDRYRHKGDGKHGEGEAKSYPYYKNEKKDKPTSENTVIYENGFCQKNFVIVIAPGENSKEIVNKEGPVWSSPLTNYITENNDYPNDAQLDIGSDPFYPIHNWMISLYDMDLRPDLKNKNNIVPYYIGFTDLTMTGQSVEEFDLLNQILGKEGGAVAVSNLQQIQEELSEVLHKIVSQSSTVGGVVNSNRLNIHSKIFLSSFRSDNWSGDIKAYALKLDTDIKVDDYEWSAAEKLSKNLSRNVYTYNEATNKGVSFKASNWVNLSAIQKKDLGFVEYSPGTEDPFVVDSDIGKKRIDYLLGELSKDEIDAAGFRDRDNLIGDIFRSSPVYVDESSTVLKDVKRDSMVYVGSNNGMLHAFRASDGHEMFAYVPSSLSTEELLGKGNKTDGGLQRLTDPEYQHRFYVDLPAWYADVQLDKEWKTVLVGGTGSGGKGLFALDITQPDAFGANNVLWEVHGEADPTPENDKDVAELGYIIGRPTITKTNLEKEKWAVFVTSGYNSSDEEKARLYILNIENGSVIKELKIDSSSLSTPTTYDMDGDGRADRVYAGDLQGNMWAFDISAENKDDWKVAFDSQPLYTVKQPDSGEPQPIIAEPAVVEHPSQTKEGDDPNNPNLLIMFGTGQYLNETDLNDTSVQSFYAIWDQGEALDDTSAFLERPFVNRTNALKNGDNKEIISVRTFADSEEAEMDWGKYQGWRIDFRADAGERIVTHPIPRGAFIHFNTLIPDSRVCAAGGRGYLMSVCMDTGGTCGNSSFNFDVTLEEEGTFQPIGLPLGGIPGQSSFVQAAGYDLLLTPPHMTLPDEATVHFTELDDLTPAMRMSWREILE